MVFFPSSCKTNLSLIKRTWHISSYYYFGLCLHLNAVGPWLLPSTCPKHHLQAGIRRQPFNSKLLTHSLTHSGVLLVQTGNLKKGWFLFFSQEMVSWLSAVTKFWSPSTLNWHLTAAIEQVPTQETARGTHVLFPQLLWMLCILKASPGRGWEYNPNRLFYRGGRRWLSS